VDQNKKQQQPTSYNSCWIAASSPKNGKKHIETIKQHDDSHHHAVIRWIFFNCITIGPLPDII